MRLAVVILVMLGLLAAGAATLLFQYIKDRNVEEKQVAVLVAQTDLAADTKLQAEHLKVEKVPERALPAGYLTHPTQANGLILTVEKTAGEIITTGVLRRRNRLEDYLGSGMRAIPVPTSKVSGATMLDPGSLVDLHVTFPLRDRELGEALSIPGLLQQLRVLAVGNRSIVPTAEGEVEKVTGRSSSRDNVLQLEVTDAQSSIVQLALKEGTVTLPLRSRSDRQYSLVQPMVWKEGKMTPFGPRLNPEDPAGMMDVLRTLPVGQPLMAQDDTQVLTASLDPNNNGGDPNAQRVQELPPLLEQPAAPTTRTVEIIRGKERSNVDVPVGGPDDEGFASRGDGMTP